MFKHEDPQELYKILPHPENDIYVTSWTSVPFNRESLQCLVGGTICFYKRFISNCCNKNTFHRSLMCWVTHDHIRSVSVATWSS